MLDALIQLYNSDVTDFTHNGHVLQDVSNDTVTWQLNAKFELQFDYPLFSPYGFELTEERLITVPTPSIHNHDQAFRIDTVTKSMGMLTVHAYHVFWDLMQNFVEDTNVVDKTGSDALKQILERTQYESGFKVASNLANVATARMVRMSALAALIGTDDNTFVSRWGGEFEWDNFEFNVADKIGSDRGVIFRDGKNLTGYSAQTATANVVTRIMPEGYNGLLLPEKYVDSPLIGNYRKPRIAVVQYSDVKAIDENTASDDENAVPLEEAYDLLRKAAKADFETNNLDKPATTYKLNVILLENTEEYRDKGQFNRVYPGDTATFIHSKDREEVKAELTAFTWSPVQQEYLTVTFDSTTKPSPDVNHTITRLQSQVTSIDRNVKAVAANGKNANTWSDKAPTDADTGTEGDVWYDQEGSKITMYKYEGGKWTKAVDDLTGEEIRKEVDEKAAQIPDLKAQIEAAMAQAEANAANFGDMTATLASVSDAMDNVKEGMTEAAANALTALNQAEDLTENYTQIKTDIDDVKGTMSTLASQQIVDDLKNTVTQTAAGLDLANDQLALKADSTITDKLNKSVDSLSGQMKIQADKVQTMVTKSELTAATSGFVTEEYVQAQTDILADSITNTVSKLNAQVNAMGQVNQLNNSEWDPDFSGWKFWLFNGGIRMVRQDGSHDGSRILNMGSPATSDTNIKDKPTVEFISGWIPVTPGRKVSVSIDAIRYWVPTDGTDNSARVQFQYANTSNTQNFDLSADISKYGDGILNFYSGSTNNQWQTYKVSTTVPDGMLYVRLYGWVKGVHSDLNISRPMIVIDQDVGVYVPGRYNNNAALTALSQKADNIEAIAINSEDEISRLQLDIAGIQATVSDGVTQEQLTLLNNQLTSTITSVNNVVRGNLLLGTANSLTVTGTGNANQGCGKYTLQRDALGQQVTLGFAITASSDGGTFIPQTGDGYQTWQLSGVTSVPIKKGWNWYTYTFVLGSETDKTKSLTMQWRLDNFPVGATFTVSTASVTLGTSGPRFWAPNPSEQATQSQFLQLQNELSLSVQSDDVKSMIDVSLAGLVLSGQQIWITGDTYIEYAAIQDSAIANLSASKLTAGSIDANVIDVINLNASNITTGTINGANLMIDLNSGEILFTKGAIKSINGLLNISVDNGTMDVRDTGNNGIHFANGALYLVDNAWMNGQDPTYGSISFNSNYIKETGMFVIAKDDLVLGTSKYKGVTVPGNAIAGAGMTIRNDLTEIENPKAISLQAGTSTKQDYGLPVFPQLLIGANVTGSELNAIANGGTDAALMGDTIALTSFAGGGPSTFFITTDDTGKRVGSRDIYFRTYSSGDHVVVTSYGTLGRLTSARKYKVADTAATGVINKAKRILKIKPAEWYDKTEMESLAKSLTNGTTPAADVRIEKHYGFIADDFDAAGLNEVVTYRDGEVDNLAYDRISMYHNVILNDHEERLKKLEAIINGTSTN
ncbi:hypothetical protein FC07_GL002693 [Loigolactobacillus bifermentans DSM 20003]|uniref:Peptidase S74 domain-containing protein n=1 Tax=Loigolactobacillus bifermentans DSM 20003 TaxID=1423726 RepID=A0A0R1H5B0_9LACO|nr:hypothetical protein FC07_GL002693 [Loigolactobacillus bifermentans DSM 20003]